MGAKAQLRDISALDYNGRIKTMDDGQLKAYFQLLDEFVEKVPSFDAEIKEALKARDYDAIMENLTSARDMLSHIYADDLAAECQKHIRWLEEPQKPEYKEIEDALDSTYSLVLSLSIDIQMMDGGVNTAEDGSEKQQARDITGQKSILAVDDAVFFLNVIKRVLQGSPYKLTCVSSGKAALGFLKNDTPDLFILDVNMPEMSGFDLAVKIRETDKNTPIIFLTSLGTAEHVRKAIASGGTDFIVKPANKKQILKRIAKHIGD
jgi:CheY-like chemotaxis protein/HPt (histidine-containing phosphotransfer) domain-containing protein